MKTAGGTSVKLVYRFAEGGASMADILGGKGANLAEMVRLGLPVPPGFTISTEACRRYYRGDRQLPPGLWDEIRGLLGETEQAMGRGFGSTERPLLVSVRSGSRYSMPGMMDTVLNLGLNDHTARALALEAGDRRLAPAASRPFVQASAAGGGGGERRAALPRGRRRPVNPDLRKGGAPGRPGAVRGDAGGGEGARR